MKPLRFYVEIVKRGTDYVLKRMGPFSDAKAVHVEAGVNINLNHNDYYTQIEEEE